MTSENKDLYISDEVVGHELIPGEYYELSFYVKAGAALPGGNLYVVNGDNASFLITASNLDTEWTKYSKVFFANTSVFQNWWYGE